MLVPPSPTTAAYPTSWDSKPTWKARGAQRRVYGKRRVDAPRAVLEHGSPLKLLEKATEESVRDAVDGIQAKLAKVTLNESSADSGSEEESAQSLHEENGVEHTPTPTLEALEPETARTRSPAHESLKSEKRYERMVEVRITPRKLETEPTSDTKYDCFTSSKARKTRHLSPANFLSQSQFVYFSVRPFGQFDNLKRIASSSSPRVKFLDTLSGNRRYSLVKHCADICVDFFVGDEA